MTDRLAQPANTQGSIKIDWNSDGKNTGQWDIKLR